MKNIEIFLIEVKQQVCDEEKIVEESTLDIKPLHMEIISCKKQNNFSKECREEKIIVSKKKTEVKREERSEEEENYTMPVKRRTGPILNSVHLILNAGTLYNMNY